MKLLAFTLLTAFLCGCASNTAVDSLVAEVEALKKTNQQMASDMERFKLSYNPKMEQVLIQNLEKIDKLVATSEDRSSRISNIENEVSNMRDNSIEATETIQKNLEETNSRNITRSFNSLRYDINQWQEDINAMVTEDRNQLSRTASTTAEQGERLDKLERLLKDYNVLIYRLDELEMKLEQSQSQ